MVERRDRVVGGRDAAAGEERPVTVPENGPKRSPVSESDDARRNRQLTELLNELRAALPGVRYAAVIGSLLLGMLVVLWYVLPPAVRLRLVE